MTWQIDDPNRPGPRIDNHLHLLAGEWFTGPIFDRPPPRNRRRTPYRPEVPRSGIGIGPGQARRAPAFSMRLDDAADALVAQMDAAGIDIAFLMAMDFDHTGERLAVDHWAQLEQLRAQQDRHPGRFEVFCGIDPRRGPQASVDLVRRAVSDLGCVGVKFLPHWGFATDDVDLCYPIYRACVELNVPVASNCSSIGDSHAAADTCHPMRFETVAHDFPTLGICLAHGGVPYHAEYALALVAQKQNVYLDISDWQSNLVGPQRFLRHLRRLMDVAPHKVMFASDYPVFHSLYDEREWVELTISGGTEFDIAFTDEELDLLFTHNAQDYLDRDLAVPADDRSP